jgi:hypothetical protein
LTGILLSTQLDRQFLVVPKEGSAAVMAVTAAQARQVIRSGGVQEGSLAGDQQETGIVHVEE